MTTASFQPFSVEDILPVAQSLLEAECDPIANMANLSALLFEALPEVNWVGFYLMEEAGSAKALTLGPFQGRVACTRIALGKGVCGTAAQTGQTQRIADVHTFEGHIACDSLSASEIVLPVFRNGTVYAVLDIDSPRRNRFSAEDQSMLQKLVALFEATL